MINDDITELQLRLGKAQADRDTWRTSGMQEKYLEAYSRVEALELQLDRLRQQGLHSRAMDHAAQADAVQVPGQWQQLMERIARSRR